MRVTGEWLLRDDGVVRPIMRAKALGSAGNLTSERLSGNKAFIREEVMSYTGQG